MAYGDLGAGNTGLTEVDVFIPELWSDAVYDYLERKLVFRNLVDDYSPLVKGKGDVINVPSVGEITVEDKAENTAIQYDAQTETSVALSIDKHKYASKIFEDIAEIQAQPGMVAKYAQAIGYALAKQIDLDIASKVITLTPGATLTADDTISDAELEAALSSLGEADLDYAAGEVVFAVNPTLYADLLHNSKFIRYDALGGGAPSPIATGNLGSIYGMPVVMTNALATGGTDVSGVMFHKSAVGFALQNGVRMQSQYDIDHLGEKVVGDAIYGTGLIHAGYGYKFTNAS